MKKDSRVFIAGHKGLVGSALLRLLTKRGYTNIVTRTRKDLDLLDDEKVADFFKKEKIEYVFDAAAKVGGIMANKNYPADFIYQNLKIQTNIIHNCYLYGVKKLLFLGSSCIYPKHAVQPITESSLLSGYLESSNQSYAIAKIAGIEMCRAYNEQYKTDFISVMPTNLYGQNDNFDPESSHVLPALIRKFHDAKLNNAPSVSMWGTGSAKREFLHVDDMADACLFIMEHYSGSDIINIGYGQDISIKELSELIQKITGNSSLLIWDSSKPDGTPRKLLDSTKLFNLGWKPNIGLEQGIRDVYKWYIEHYEKKSNK